MFGQQLGQIDQTEHITKHNSQQLGLPISADSIETRAREIERGQAAQMFLYRDATVQVLAARDVLEKLWPANEKASGELAGVERFYQQLEQPGICHEQLEEQTAQAVGLNKPDELIESCVRVRGFRKPVEQERTQLAKDLACAWRDMEADGGLRQIGQCLGGASLIAENCQINRLCFRGFFRNDAPKN